MCVCTEMYITEKQQNVNSGKAKLPEMRGFRINFYFISIFFSIIFMTEQAIFITEKVSLGL